ncbi:hypothetical protein D3C71_1919110 [compost metagenome]
MLPSVASARRKCGRLYSPPPAVFCAMPTATEARPRPITTITGPTTMGGRIASSQRTPKARISRATAT